MVHVLRQRGDVEIGALLTTINESAQRVAMHAVRVDVLEAQARAARRCRCGWCRFRRRARTRSTRRRWRTRCARRRARASRTSAFGDLFLEDIRRYREERLAGTGLTPLFPLFERRHRGARARDDRRRPARANHVRQPEGPRSLVCRTRIRRRAARATCRRSVDPVRRARRIPHLRLRRPDVQPTRSDRDRRSPSSATASSSPT